MRAGIASPCLPPWGFPGGTSGKERACQMKETWDMDLIPGSGRSPAGGQGNPLQYSCLENSHGHKTWWAVVYSVAKSWTWLSDLAHMHVPLLSSTKNSSISTLTCWEMRMLFSGEKGLSQNCPLNICLIGNKVGCCWLSIILAVPINGIIYYWITLFAKALENSFTQVEQIGLEQGGEAICLYC